MMRVGFLCGVMAINNARHGERWRDVIPTAYHQSRYWDWCMSKDKNRDR